IGWTFLRGEGVVVLFLVLVDEAGEAGTDQQRERDATGHVDGRRDRPGQLVMLRGWAWHRTGRERGGWLCSRRRWLRGTELELGDGERLLVGLRADLDALLPGLFPGSAGPNDVRAGIDRRSRPQRC